MLTLIKKTTDRGKEYFLPDGTTAVAVIALHTAALYEVWPAPAFRLDSFPFLWCSLEAAETAVLALAIDHENDSMAGERPPTQWDKLATAARALERIVAPFVDAGKSGFEMVQAVTALRSALKRLGR